MGFLRGRLGSQIGKFLRGKNISCICKKLALLTLLNINFFIFLGAIILLCNFQWNRHYIKENNWWPSHIGNDIKNIKTANNWGLFLIAVHQCVKVFFSWSGGGGGGGGGQKEGNKA